MAIVTAIIVTRRLVMMLEATVSPNEYIVHDGGADKNYDGDTDANHTTS